MNKSCNMLFIGNTTYWAQTEYPDEEGRGTDEPDGNGPIGDQTEYHSTGQNFCQRLMTLLRLPCSSALSVTPFPICINFTAWSQ
ncbi:hypothetical protein BS17DRAFT_780775 [Gyrodon lividus]|nr:hypothetical protein BS17DRAFT_780775 [Gyrodon lividus]